jgi:hypothetical protein
MDRDSDAAMRAPVWVGERPTVGRSPERSAGI